MGECRHVGERRKERVVEQRRAARGRRREEDHPKKHKPKARVDDSLTGHAAQIDRWGPLCAACSGVQPRRMAVYARPPIADGDVEGTFVLPARRGGKDGQDEVRKS